MSLTNARKTALFTGPQGPQGPPGPPGPSGSAGGLQTTSVGGTGFWWAAAGNLQNTAFTITGDTTQQTAVGTTVPLKVTGIQGNAVPVPSGTNTALLWSGSAFSWGSVSAITSFGSDLAGSTATNQWVASISGPGASGTAVPINTVGMTVQSGVSFVFSQTAAAFHNANAADLTFAAQQNTDGTSTSGKSGNVIFNVGAPPGSSTTEAYVQFNRAGSPMLYFGADPGAPGDTGIWFAAQAGGGPTGSNFGFLANSAQTYLNAPSWIFLTTPSSSVQLNATTVALEPGGAIGGGATTLGSTTYPWPSVYANAYIFPATTNPPKLYQLTQVHSSGLAPQLLLIQAQEQSGSDEGSSALNTPGSIVLNFGVPYTTTNAGNEGAVLVKRNGTFIASIQNDPSFPTTFSGLWLGPGITPSNTNFAVLSDGVNTTYVQGPSAITFQVATGSIFTASSTGCVPGSDNVYVLGTAADRWKSLVVGPTGVNVLHAASDANPVAQLTDNSGSGELLFGPGGSTAVDSRLIRTAAHSFTLDNTSNGDATLFVGGTGGTAQIEIQSSTANISVTGTGPNSGTAKALTLTPQSPGATNGTGGYIIASLNPPTGSGSESFFQVQRNLLIAASIGGLPGNPTAGSILCLIPNTSPTASNYSLAGASTQVAVNAPSGGTGFLQVGSTSYVDWTNAYIYPNTDNSYQAGNNTNAWSAVTSYIFQFSTNAGTGYVKFAAAASAAGSPIAVLGQTAGSGGSGNNAGGAVALVGGNAAGTAAGGAAVIYSGQGGSSGPGAIQFGWGSNAGAAPAAADQINWTLTSTAFQMQAVTPGSVVAPLNMTFLPQAPNGGSGTAAQNTPGSFIVALPAWGTTGTAGNLPFLAISQSGTYVATIGAYSTGSPAIGAIWLGGGAGIGSTPTTSNFAVAADSASLYLNTASGSGTIFLRLGGTNYYEFTPSGVGGDGASHPFQWATPLSISCGLGGTTTPSLANLATGPRLLLTSSGTTTSQITLDFSNASTAGFWIIDTSGITFGASLGISVKNGTTTLSVTTTSAPVGNMIIVQISAANKITWH